MRSDTVLPVKAKHQKSMAGKTGQTSREAVVRNLNQVMQRDNSLSRCCAIRGLMRLGAKDADSNARLIDALLDPDPDVRVDAAETLGCLQVEAAVDALLANIEGDSEGDVRIAAVKALAGIGSTAAVDGLIRCIQGSGYPELDQMVDDADFGACWEVQGSALKALGAIGDPGATQPLIELLGDEENADLEQSGFQVLAELDYERAGAFLIERLKTGETLTRRRAARALAAMTGIPSDNGVTQPELISALYDALVDPDPGVRINAAKALSTSGSPIATVSLTLLLNDPEAEVRHEVASLLGGIRGQAVVERLHDLLRQAEQKSKHQLVRVLGEIADPGSSPLLLAELKNCDPVKDRHLLHETIVALDAIGKTGPEAELVKILTDADIHYSLRVQAARALGRLNNGAATDEDVDAGQQEKDVWQALTDAVDDDNTQVSYAAITALIDIDRDQAVDRLVALLRTGTPALDGAETQEVDAPEADTDADDTPEAVREMVGDHGPDTSTLAAILARPAVARPNVEHGESQQQAEIHSDKRALAARLLGNIPDPGAWVMAALTEASADADAAVRREAILSLGRLADPKSAPVILNASTSEDVEVRLAALDALRNFTGLKKVNKRLAAMFDDPDPYIRERIVNMLNGKRSVEAAACLLRALEDTERNVCRAALARLTEDAGGEQTLQLVSNLIFKFAGDLRVDAAAALRRMHDYSTAERLVEVLNDEDREEWHWICIDALAEMYATDSIEAEHPTV